MHMKRGLYRDEDRVILPSIERIEIAYDLLLKIRSSDTASIHSLASIQVAAEKGTPQEACRQLLSDCYNYLKFFLYTNVFKTTKLAEGLIHSYNTQNHLVWSALARSSLEFSAVFYYFQKKIEEFKLSGPTLSISQIQGCEELMIKYAHGTRFNWQDLIQGNLEALTNSLDKDETRPPSINIITALDHLKKRDERFKDIKIAYSMLCDFVHPNMASHCAVVEMPCGEGLTHDCVMSLNPGPERGAFFMILTLRWVAMALDNVVELLPPLCRPIEFLLNLLDGSEKITIDFTS